MAFDPTKEEVDKVYQDLRTAREHQFDLPSDNNGGSTDYYKLKPSWKDVIDIIEDRGMNYSQGNIFKVAMTFNVGRHDATNYERELNKVIFFANRELERIKL